MSWGPSRRRPSIALALGAASASIIGFCLFALPAVATARTAGPSLRLGSARIGTRSAPLTLSVQAPRGAELGLRVNGRRIRDAFRFVGGDVHLAQLDAADGLVPGANELRVRAAARTTSDTVHRTVTVPRYALLADAGPDVDTYVDSAVSLGVPHARSAAVPGLQDRWRIVDRPDGSQAMLTHRRAARPVLKADAPGTYVLSLTTYVNGSHQVSHDDTTVSVSPADPPIGAPIDTIGPDGAIVIGGRSFGGSSNPDTLSYVVLERATRTPVPGASGSVGNDDAGIATIDKLANDYGNDQNYLHYLMIVSGRRGVRPASIGKLGPALKKIGAAVLSPENVAALGNGQSFSVIGIPGAPAGAATVRIPSSHPSVSGAITGYLQKNLITKDGSEAYDYVSPDHPAYDTRAEGSTDRKNVMIVGDHRFEASLPADATAGLHVVMLDSFTLQPLDSAALITNSTDARQGPALQGGTAEWIKLRLDKFKDPIVLVQTMGKPKATSRWAEVVGQLARLGANRLLLNYLNGTNEYALVGRLGSEQPPAEASTAHDGPGDPHYPPSRLVGVFSRTRASTLEPTLTDTPTPKSPSGAVNLEMIKIAYQPTQPWPVLGGTAPPAESAAAEHFICVSLNFCGTKDSCPDIRSCYWQKPGSNWEQKSTDLTNLQYPGAGLGFGAAVFGSEKSELLLEMSKVAQVHKYMHLIQEPLVESGLSTYVDLQKIGKSIDESVHPPPGSNSTAWTLGLVSKIAALGGVAGGAPGAVAKGLSAGLALGAYLADEKGKPILAADIQAKTQDLAEELLNRITLARKEIDNLEKLYVSDYGKLNAVFPHIDSDWSIDNPFQADAELRTAAQQWFYEALVPAAYPYLIRAGAGNARDLDCMDQGRAKAWPNQPDGAQMQAPVGYNSNGDPQRAVFFFTRGIFGGSSPPGTLADDMFLPLTGRRTGAGLEKLAFFTPRVFNGQILHATPGSYLCDVGFLPKIH